MTYRMVDIYTLSFLTKFQLITLMNFKVTATEWAPITG